jgi:uncharacterized protein (TIGR03067 family)
VYVLIMHMALIGSLDPMPYAAQMGEMTVPPLGTWRVRDIIEGAASSRIGKEMIKRLRVQITGKRLVVTGGEEREEYVIVGINPTQGPVAIDLRDLTYGRTYRGIYEREGMRLRISIQFWTTGNAKTSVRPKSFKDADSANVFGPTLYLLELD